ncbi:hypothetical protein HSX11_19860 [Oxalobacteraceae bacterium]|nr:hypothetical protein [Oxalobacteraceae bacterium]
MFPMFFWAPQVHLPWSGSVAQTIDLERFFNAIPAQSGDGKIEREAFEVASYGSQLGWLTEVLLDITRSAPPAAPEARAALSYLVEANDKIQELKKAGKAEAERQARSIEDSLLALKKTDAARFASLSERLLPLLAPEVVHGHAAALPAGDGGAKVRPQMSEPD